MLKIPIPGRGEGEGDMSPGQGQGGEQEGGPGHPDLTSHSETEGWLVVSQGPLGCRVEGQGPGHQDPYLHRHHMARVHRTAHGLLRAAKQQTNEHVAVSLFSHCTLGEDLYLKKILLKKSSKK